ncbi:MAG: hypothetical protein WB676_23040 [Bryobacteraceae bacterium]
MALLNLDDQRRVSNGLRETGLEFIVTVVEDHESPAWIAQFRVNDKLVAVKLPVEWQLEEDLRFFRIAVVDCAKQIYRIAK